MSYGVSAALQAAIYGALTGFGPLNDLVDGAIYDALPPGILPDLYVVLGEEKVRDNSDKTGAGAEHEFTVSVITDLAGFASAKAVAGAISDALIGADMVLSRGALVGLEFHKATAARVGSGDQRQIDVIFRARVEDD